MVGKIILYFLFKHKNVKASGSNHLYFIKTSQWSLYELDDYICLLYVQFTLPFLFLFISVSVISWLDYSTNWATLQIQKLAQYKTKWGYIIVPYINFNHSFFM